MDRPATRLLRHGVLDPQRPVLSVDDIQRMLSDIAQDAGAGADRFRALKMLSGLGSANVTLPEPLSREERRQRASRIMQALGIEETRLAFKETWGSANPVDQHTEIGVLDEFPDWIRVMSQRCKTLIILYRTFPAMKRPGVPPGYPTHHGKIEQMKFCQKMAAKEYLAMFNRGELSPPLRVADAPTA